MIQGRPPLVGSMRAGCSPRLLGNATHDEVVPQGRRPLLLGGYAGRLLAGESPQLGLIDASRQQPVPFHSLRTPGVRRVAGWYQLLDALGR
jgi:hypothetical protein